MLGFEVTREWLKKHTKGGKSFTADQARVLGVGKGKGWKRRAIGTVITEQQKQRFEQGLKWKEAKKEVKPVQKMKGDVVFAFTQRELEQIAEWAERYDKGHDPMPWPMRQLCRASTEKPSEGKSPRWGNLTAEQIDAAKTGGCKNEAEYLEARAKANHIYEALRS